VPARLINIKYITIRAEKVASPVTALHRHHWSNDDCLEGNKENYQVCSVQYIVRSNYAQCNAHTYEQTNSSLDWVLSRWAHFTVLRFISVYVLLHACVGL